VVADADCHGIVEHGGGPTRRLRDHRLRPPAADLVQFGDMVVTSELRTLTDLLCYERVRSSLPTVTDALRRGLLVPGDLATVARAAAGRRGARRAHLIALTCVGNPWSVLEWRFQRIACSISSGWTFNVDASDGRGRIGGVDAFHEEYGIVVELDGKRFHGPERFQKDRTRDHRLVALGYVVLRFTWDDIERRPDEVRAILRRTMAQRIHRAG
jgi:hypothetical protein